jgi:cytosine/adenosine deaminase-related metal-dependent hydrolase
VLDAQTVVERGAVRVQGGRIAAVHAAHEVARAARSAPVVVDLGDAALTAGLVDAHAHLELTDLAGRVPRGGDFPSWIRALVSARGGLDVAGSVRRGLAELAASGTVAVGDVAGAWTDTDLVRELEERPGMLHLVVHREVLDAGDEARGRAGVDDAARLLARHAATRGAVALVQPGLSPHAPYTVLDATLARCGALVREHPVPVQVHHAETEEEEAWLAGRPGPFDQLLGPPQVRGETLARLDRAGLLGPRTALVHGNHPAAGAARLAGARGTRVVHCPGAHAWFGRAPFPLEEWLAAGVELALGTDSRAGNERLDMRRELALAARAFPALAPRRLWQAATENGARVLGLEERVGRLAVGRPFTAAAFASAARDEEQLFHELVAGEPPTLASWVAGRVAWEPGPDAACW